MHTTVWRSGLSREHELAKPSPSAWDAYAGDATPGDRASRDFTLGDLTVSATAVRLGIDNWFTGIAELRAAVYLCRNVLQPIADAFGAFLPNSVFRCQALERALKNKPAGWTSTSQHVIGQACDLEIPGMPTLELAEWVSRHLEYDQLICECYDPAQGPNSGWVHVSLVSPGLRSNRGELLSYVRDSASGQYVYVEGLRAAG